MSKKKTEKKAVKKTEKKAEQKSEQKAEKKAEKTTETKEAKRENYVLTEINRGVKPPLVVEALVKQGLQQEAAQELVTKIYQARKGTLRVKGVKYMAMGMSAALIGVILNFLLVFLDPMNSPMALALIIGLLSWILGVGGIIYALGGAIQAATGSNLMDFLTRKR